MKKIALKCEIFFLPKSFSNSIFESATFMFYFCWYISWTIHSHKTETSNEFSVTQWKAIFNEIPPQVSEYLLRFILEIKIHLCEASITTYCSWNRLSSLEWKKIFIKTFKTTCQLFVISQMEYISLPTDKSLILISRIFISIQKKKIMKKLTGNVQIVQTKSIDLN